VVFIVDDLLGWLVGLVADAGRKKLVTLVLGSDQERALRQATVAAVEATAAQLAPSGEQADQLAMAVGKVFRGAPKVALAGRGTLLEALQAGIADRLAVPEDPAATGTGQSVMGLLGVSAGVLAETLAGHLVHEITVRGAQGGPLTPLADQLNHDMTHLQGQRLEGMLAQVVSLVTDLARAGRGPQVPGKPVRLAPRPVFLAGREELLAELANRMAGDEGAGPRMVALYGLGGAGKTSVALEYAHRQLGEVGVAWQLGAEDPAVLANGFGELAAQLDAADRGDPVASVHSVLADSPAPWLLVFDNAPDRASVAPFVPPAGPGRVLITSRNPIWPPGQSLDVPVLDPQVAAEFLGNRTGDLDRQAAGELADVLGGLPLALEQAAAYVQATGNSLAGYLASFRRRRADLLVRGEPTGYPHTVATTWTLAFGDLAQAAPGAAGLLRLLAFCAPEAIPLRLLLQPRPDLVGQLGDQVTPVLVPLLEDELAAGDGVAALRRYSLVTPAGGGSVSVHRLVQVVTADQMPADLARQWRQATAALVGAALPAEPWMSRTWPVYAMLLPHVQVALRDDSDGMARLATYLGASGSYAAARDLQRKTLNARERGLGAQHPDTLAARHELGRWTGEAGDLAAARDLFAELLPVRERILGVEHPDTLAARHELALLTGQAGDPAAAREQFAELLPVRERVLGVEHPDTLATRHELAHLIGETGDPAAARHQFAELLPVREKVSGPQHPWTLGARHELARWTGEAGDPAAARDQFARLMADEQQVLGEQHPDTLNAWLELARWTGEAGDPAAARDQLAELLRVRKQILGPRHQYTLTTRYHLARWTGEAGDPAAAQDQFADLLPIVERVLSPEHPYTQDTRAQLAAWNKRAERGPSRA
jgi:Tetratricopeptide repeat